MADHTRWPTWYVGIRYQHDGDMFDSAGDTVYVTYELLGRAIPAAIRLVQSNPKRSLTVDVSVADAVTIRQVWRFASRDGGCLVTVEVWVLEAPLEGFGEFLDVLAAWDEVVRNLDASLRRLGPSPVRHTALAARR